VLTLPALPTSVQVLPEFDTERLRALYPDLPRSPADCPTCRGTKAFRWRGADGAPADYECPCHDQFLLHRWLLRAGVEKHYQRLSWDDALGVPDSALEVVQDYVTNVEHYQRVGLGLVLWGNFGTGKTFLASMLLKGAIAAGVDGMFATMHVLLDRFTEGWERREAAAWFDQRIRHAGLLVIDDIGREHSGRNAVAESTLDHVLRSRVASDRPTIITTNKTPADLATLYAGNAVSLLAESCIVHEFRGADYRPAHQARKIDEAKAGLVRPLVLS
jgi:DNA replication protein DnaC